jgi:hypothetical protein
MFGALRANPVVQSPERPSGILDIAFGSVVFHRPPVNEATAQSQETLVSIHDVDVLRATPWLVQCRISGRSVDIPRGRIDSYGSLAPGERVTLRLPLWFARAIGVGASEPDAKSIHRLETFEPQRHPPTRRCTV